MLYSYRGIWANILFCSCASLSRSLAEADVLPIRDETLRGIVSMDFLLDAAGVLADFTG
ncbi:MAG TPA: hypothetical protein PLD92_04700 [Candidatus Omnitrophota bacterium]|nr:hypothetical protein [Candidatus Omnitrophota bacterium]